LQNTLGTEIFAPGGLFFNQNAYVPESRNERGRVATFTSFLIFDSNDMESLLLKLHTVILSDQTLKKWALSSFAFQPF
jgi:hypothetical protein